MEGTRHGNPLVWDIKFFSLLLEVMKFSCLTKNYNPCNQYVSPIEHHEAIGDDKHVNGISLILETQTTLVAFTAFSHWNDHLSKPELIVIAATRKPSLLVFSFINGVVTHVGTWPLHHSVKSLELCVVELSRKVIVIPQNPRASIDIYNFESHNSSSQFW